MLHATLDEVTDIKIVNHGTEMSAYQSIGYPILQGLSELSGERNNVFPWDPEHV
jgi:hypothetical protein